MTLSSPLPTRRALLLAALLAWPVLSPAQELPGAAAAAALQARAARLGLLAADVQQPALTSTVADAGTGVQHYYLRQRYQGLDVYGAVADVHLDRSGRVLALHQNFIPNVAEAARGASPQPALDAAAGIAAAARALGLPAPQALQPRQPTDPAQQVWFGNGGISLEDIPVRLLWQPVAGTLRLAWEVTITPPDAQHVWNVRVDARTGQLLDQVDFNVPEPVSFARQGATAVAAVGAAQPGNAARGTASGIPNSYNVWPAPSESPSHGPRVVVADPADAVASPFGWHDTNGVAGADYTITRGNNVLAYDDRNQRNVYFASTGLAPDGGPTLDFDFPFSATAGPMVNQSAAIVNLFYWNNYVHDVMFRKGFDEAAGNFQMRNYSRQGLGNDYVRAEAQDGGGLNNANFSSPPDGQGGRMQMYLWEGPTTLTVNSPATVAGDIATTEANFGHSLADTGPVSGNLVLVNDGSSKPSRGCAPLLNAAAVSGNIALIERGRCEFAPKVRNAQNAGARLAIVIDSLATGPLISMGGTDTVGIRIPSLFITKANGDRLRAALAAGQTVNISASSQRRDGDLDNGIVSHEYGHGISIRLTGGPANSACLQNQEQMGEGWSDYFALWLTTKTGDTGTTPRTIGTYAVSQPTTGAGIRRKRYTTDMTVNNHTYAYVVPTTGTTHYTEVHDIGEVWCAMLWDLNWAFINRYGYNPDMKAATGGNNICLQLVLDGCKLQPCSPGFVDGRNAILKADSIRNGAANSALIWQVFARRGLGASASQGSSNSVADGTVAFNLPAVLGSTAALAQQVQALDAYPNPAHDQLTVRSPLSGTGNVQLVLRDLLGRVAHTRTASIGELQQGLTVSTADVAAGLYLVQVTGSAGTFTTKVQVRH